MGAEELPPSIVLRIFPAPTASAITRTTPRVALLAGSPVTAWATRGARTACAAPDGRWRTVKYVADGAGFRAAVSTNEPGTAPSSPASAGINAPILHVPAGHHDGGYGGYGGGYGAGAWLATTTSVTRSATPVVPPSARRPATLGVTKVGSYGIADADGRVRLVKYVADTNGFRVYISTNEPGTAASSPAGAGINAPVALPTAPAVEPLLLQPSTPLGVVAKAVPAVTAAHVYGPPIVGPILKPAAPVTAALGVFRPAYAKKSYVAAAVQPGLEVEYDGRDDRHW
ncbi:hypothetical protein MTO96_049556 [Rhipicephalus appendiculatus]